MEFVDIVLTVLSMVGAVFAWYQATGSKKARDEAAAAVERAEVGAKSAQAQAYEARKQAEATQQLVDSLKAQVDAAERAASEAGRLASAAESSNQLAEGHLSEFRRIADSLRGPVFKLNPVGENRFALTYSGDTPVQVTVDNFADFLRLSDLKESFDLQPDQTVSFLALGSAQKPVPSDLVLRVAGRDEPVRLALIRSS